MMTKKHSPAMRLVVAILTLSLFAPIVSVSAQNEARPSLTNDDVIQMVTANLSESLILSQIADSQTSFDLSTSELIRLSTSGVSDTIIEAMRAPSAAADTRPPQPVVAPVVEPPNAAVAAPVSQAPRNAAVAVTFRKFDYFQSTGEDEQKRDARIVIDGVAQEIVVADEKEGAEKELFATIPYGAVTNVVYERSAHRRYKAGLLLSPWLLFSKGKKHWLTIEFTGVESMPQGFIYARMDKDNYRQILIALRAGLGMEIEEIIED